MKSLFSLPATLEEGRALLAMSVPAARRKKLGQCFTGLQTGRLLAALAVRPGQNRIVDPMAGHGDLIESAAERAGRVGLKAVELMGVEIEPEAARLCKWRIEQCATEFGTAAGNLIHGDAFALSTWESSVGFDLVITNPPYVRYQTLSNGGQEGAVKLLGVEATRQALERLAARLAPPEERHVWQRIIRCYSGLSDLSIPSWLLCGLLTAPGGVLALVVPQTWLNRDYARIARYFFLRFFRPLAIVQESGQRWFRDALVPVSLVIGRRLPAKDVVIPLLKRGGLGETTPFVEVDPVAASARSHVGNAFRGNDPEGEFVEWLNHGVDKKPGVALKRVSWEAQRDEILATSKGTAWLGRLEGDAAIGFTGAPSSSCLPASVAYDFPAEYVRNLRPLASELICIGQGLRTGCNPFFYVELAEETSQGETAFVFTHELFGRRRIAIPSSALRSVLRRQSELASIQIAAESLHGRLLDLRAFVLPENAPNNGFARSSKWQVMPESLAEYVRLAARTYLVRGESRTLIPQLSAVKPNGLGPDEKPKPSPLFEDILPRMWYMIPDFAPRHLASLCIPRIIHDEPHAVLNCEPPVLIDANFSTLWCTGNAWNIEAVFAVLNSTWGELCMEALGATLGGGALKLEATHLRQLPLPALADSQKQQIQSLVREALVKRSTLTAFQRYRATIDEMIVSALAGRRLSTTETRISIEKLVEIVLALRAKRRRKPDFQPLVAE
ncbi:MAG: TRM11 family SAM-dependent methyltransferase [Pirellulaceae bacterium]